MFGGMLAGQLQTAMSPRNSGLFGSIGQAARRPRPQQQPEQPPMQNMATPQPQQSQGIGSRLLGQGWEGKVAALGAMLAGDPNAVGRYHADQQSQAAEAQQRAFELAQAQRERSLDRQDWQWQQDYQRENPTPTALERNTQAWADMSPEERAAYAEYAQAGRPEENVVVPLPGGRTYVGPNSGLTQVFGQQAQGNPPPETLPADFNFGGGPAGNSGGGF